jgi:hypothetical protein
MELEDLTIVIPIKNPPNISVFIKENEWLLKSKANKVIVDSGGGRIFQGARKLGFLPLLYEARDCLIWEARKLGYEYAVTPFTLNLDVDTIINCLYVDQALGILKKKKAQAVAIDYERLQGHYAFGTSIWRTKILKKLYDYPPAAVDKLIKVGQQQWVTAFQNGFCECTYMWSHLIKSGGRLETLDFRAKHLKSNSC